MRHLIFCAALFTLSSLMCSSAHAAASDMDKFCDGLGSAKTSADPSNWLRVGRVVGNGPAHFLPQPSPECDPQYCHAYVVAGDAVALTTDFAGYKCAQYAKNSSRMHVYDGWIPAERVVIEHHPEWEKDLSAWTGTWGSDDALIHIATVNGQLQVTGKAAWQGRSDPHFGGFNSKGSPDADGLTLTNTDGVPAALLKAACTVRLELIGKLMVAVDNENCGGTNVSFTGFYEKGRISSFLKEVGQGDPLTPYSP